MIKPITLPPLPDDLIAHRMTETEVRSLLKQYGERCATAAVEADRQARGEPVYQVNMKGNGWEDCSLDRYESAGRVMEQDAQKGWKRWERRVLWSAPQPAEPETKKSLTRDKIELPPLPDWFAGYSSADKHVVQSFAYAAIEADRKHFAELFMDLSRYAAGMYEQDHDPQMEGVSDGYWYAAEFLLGNRDAVKELEADRKRGGEPVAKVRDRGFEVVDGKHVPTVLVEFPVDDWESRDRFVAAINTPQPAEPSRAPTLHNADSGAQNGVQATQPAEPVAWLRNERDGYEGKEVFDPLVILGSAPPTKTVNGATYAPVYAAPQPAEPSGAQNGIHAPQPPQIPEGYKLVPIEPTEEMLRAAYHAVESEAVTTTAWLRKTVYKAMLEAAPASGEES